MNFFSWRLLPYLHQYVKTNYFTALFIILIGTCLAIKYTPLAASLSRFTKKFEERRSWRILFFCGIFIIAAALRLSWVGSISYRPVFEWADGPAHHFTLTEYDGINIQAKAVTKGIWFRDESGVPLVRRPIGYPLLLAFFYKIFGAHLFVTYAVNITLIFLTIFLVYLLAQELFDTKVAIVAASFFAIYPPSVYSFSLPMDELLFMPLWYLGIYLLFREVNGKRLPYALLLYGLIFGYSTIVRTQTIFMPIIVAGVYLFFLRKSLLRSVGAFIMVAAIMFSMTLPWIARNYKHFGCVIPYASPYHEFYPYNNPSVSKGEVKSWPQEGEKGYKEWVALRDAWDAYDIALTQKLAIQELRSYILNYPVSFLLAGTERILVFFAPDRSRGVWAIDIIQTAMEHRPDLLLPVKLENFGEEVAFFAYYVVFYSFVIGTGCVIAGWAEKTQSQKRALLIIGACFLFYVAEQFVVFPERRYRFPLEPFMLIIGSAWLVHIRLKKSKQS